MEPGAAFGDLRTLLRAGEGWPWATDDLTVTLPSNEGDESGDRGEPGMKLVKQENRAGHVSGVQKKRLERRPSLCAPSLRMITWDQAGKLSLLCSLSFPWK